MKRTTAAALLGVACLLAMPPIAQARYRDGMNLYQYVRSAPVTHLDPMGLETVVALDTEKGKEPVEVEGYLEVRVAGAVVKREPVKETITYKASFEREARRFNALVDEKIKEIQSSNDDRFTLNGTPVKKGKLIKGLKNARIVVMDIDSGNEAKAYAQIRAAFTKAGPEGVVLLETHAGREMWVMNDPDRGEGPDVAGRLVIGGRSTKLSDVATRIGRRPAKSARIAFGSCFWSKAKLQMMADRLNALAAATGGFAHPVQSKLRLETKTRTINGRKELVVAIELVTPFDAQQMRVSPRPRTPGSAPATAPREPATTQPVR